MSYTLWFVSITLGFILGRFTCPKEKSTTNERLESSIHSLQEDIAYYKKLTRNLVAENKELRLKIESN